MKILGKTNKKIKTCAAAAAAALMLALPPCAAEASIAVNRIDKYVETMIHSVSLEFMNFVQDTLTNLDDVKAILDLKDTYKDLGDMIKDFDGFDLEDMLEDELDDFTDGTLSKTLSSVLSSGVNGGDLSSKSSELIKEAAEAGAEAISSGEPAGAARNVLAKVKNVIEESAGLTLTGQSGTDEKKEEEKKDVSEMSEKEQTEEAVRSATKLAKEVSPMSFSGAQATAAQIAAGSGAVPEAQQVYAMELADAGRVGAVKEIVKLLAPYTADRESKASYRYPIVKIREQADKALERASDHSSAGPGSALKAIAGLSAVLVEQQNLQNELLIMLADILADDIKMTGVNALLGIEGYTSGLQENVGRYIEIYNRTEEMK